MMQNFFRWLTTTPSFRALESEVARQDAEVTRQRGENDQQRAIIASQQNEIARLRAENRALLNSILGIAGIPPVLVSSLPSQLDQSSVSLPASCHSESAAADGNRPSTQFPPAPFVDRDFPGRNSPRSDIPPQVSSPSSSLPSSSFPSPPSSRRQVATPTRRRSWHQIMRTLEFESGKKPAASD
jgi:hypothetical protein